MAKTKISEFDIDPANNTDINSINIAEGCAPSGINNAIRQLMSDLKEFQTGAGGDPFNGAVNGTVGATTPNTGAFTTLSASGAFSANGGATLGDASGDALTINSSAVSIPNGLNFDSNTFVIDATNNNVGIGTSSPSSFDSTARKLVVGTGSGDQGMTIYSGTGNANIFFASGTTGSQLYNGYIQYNQGNNSMVLGTAATARATLDSSGNLGLGVTPSAWASGYKALQVGKTAVLWGGASSNDIYFGNNYYFDGSALKYISTGFASEYFQDSGKHVWRTAPSGTAGNAISFTQAMTLDASGNLGIGTTSPTRDSGTRSIAINGGVLAASLDLTCTSGRSYAIYTSSSATGLQFYDLTASAERMRIDSSGNLLVGATSVFGGAPFCVKGPADANQQVAAIWNPATSGTRYFMSFATEGGVTERGYITYNGTSVAISQASDERLKENIVEAPSALPKIEAMKIRSFDFKEDGRHVDYGVIAQELYSIIPSAVFEGSDNEDGTINKPWSVGLEPIIPVLVKAIQELKAEVDALKAQLENK